MAKGEIWITSLATEDDARYGWDIEGDGMPGVGFFGNAVQVWAIAQNRMDITINEAALAFNVAPNLIRQAVEEHPWMFIGNDDVIEHDGE